MQWQIDWDALLLSKAILPMHIQHNDRIKSKRRRLSSFATIIALIGFHFVFWNVMNVRPKAKMKSQVDITQIPAPILLAIPMIGRKPLAATNPDNEAIFTKRPNQKKASLQTPQLDQSTRQIGATKDPSAPAPAASGDAISAENNALETRGENRARGGGNKIDYGKIGRTIKGIGSGEPSRSSLAAENNQTATEKLGQEFAKGKRLNCETAHAHLGLLAIPFLLKDTLTDRGCQW